MHIAFDGGCFQQGILGGIYHVACGFLNAAKANHPSLKVTLVCDPRQGGVREDALSGLSWRPDIVFGAVLATADQPESWPVIRDPHVRFFVDGRVLPAVLRNGTATYVGPRPISAFAILSRSAGSTGSPASEPSRGIQIGAIAISSLGEDNTTLWIDGTDRRLVAGYCDADGGRRWTDGAGFIPVSLFGEADGSVEVRIEYSARDGYPMAPGPGADMILKVRRQKAASERARNLEILSGNLRRQGCTVYFTNHFTPIIMPDMLNVAWAYDLIPILFPQYFHADARLNFDENLRVFGAADRVYAISDCTREDLVAHSQVTEAQVVTAGIAISSSFCPQSSASIQRVLAPLGLKEGGYIIAVATIEPRKNHMRLLLAYLELRRRVPHCPSLLIVGQRGWDFDQVLALCAESGLERSVKFLSEVPEGDLASLYSGALFSAYLSVYEGFGLPIVEAMATGCPVLTSDRSSMAEVAVDAAVLVNPYEIDAIAEALQRLTNDKSLRKSLARRGLERARHYDWNRSSRIILNDLSQLHGDD